MDVLPWVVPTVSICTVAVGLVVFWIDVRNRAATAEAKADAALTEAKKAQDMVSALQAAIAVYREMQAERLVSRDILREVEERLGKAIALLGDRLDGVLREALGRHT